MELNPVSAREQRKLDQKKAGKAHSPSGVSFESAVQEASSAETSQSVDALMNDLRDQEKKFLDTQSQYDLEKYKMLLRKILKMLTSDSYQAETFQRSRRSGKEPFLIIRLINEKVDELGRILVSRENKAFALLRALEDIRGLILDLKN